MKLYFVVASDKDNGSGVRVGQPELGVLAEDVTVGEVTTPAFDRAVAAVRAADPTRRVTGCRQAGQIDIDATS